MDEKIVYIIIVVIWVVSSLIKAFNKKNKPQTPHSQTPQSGKTKPAGELDDFKKILEEIISGKQQMPQSQKVDDYKVEETQEYNYEPVTTSSKYAAFEGATDYNFNQYASLEDTYNQDNNRINSKKHEDNAYNSNSGDEAINNNIISNDGFDIRKAVIYSEILKRPHY